MPTVADNVYNRLREMLANSEFEPGQRMPQLRLARRLGCSPLPILEALRRLESEGLITKRPRKIARVRKLSARELEGLYVVREGLESMAARLCAQRINNEQIKHLCELADQIEEAVDRADTATESKLELAIHKAIAKYSDCPLLAEELGRMLLVERTAVEEPGTPFPPNFRSAHRAIIRAIMDHDADSAEYLMRKHIRAGMAEGALDRRENQKQDNSPRPD